MMSNTLKDLREQVYRANIDLVKHGLVIFTWGNVSAIDRNLGLIAIKPSGVKYEDMRPEDMVIVDFDGKVIEGDLRPSSDTPTHIEVYKKINTTSIVHTHSQWATIFSQAGREIPALGTTHADYFYGSVPCTREMTNAEIATDYEKNTGKVISELLSDKEPNTIPGVLVRNHGPFAWGETPEEAVHNATVLEYLAMMAKHTFDLNPGAESISQTLLDKHFLRKHGKDKYYGQEEKKGNS